jgi:hypothetical protein
VRCWFAPHDLPIGSQFRDEIGAAIRRRDKVLLVLSEHSILSKRVEDEVEQAYEEEEKRDQVVLFPIRLDDAVITTDKAWASARVTSATSGAGKITTSTRITSSVWYVI